MPQDPRQQKKKAAFRNVTDKDPLKIDRFSKGTEADNKKKNIIYALCASIFFCMLMSVMFFLIANMEQMVNGSQQDEQDALMQQKLQDYIDHTPGAKNASSGRGSGSKHEMTGDSLEEVQVGLKLVPNMDQHNFLLRRMTLVGGDNGYTGLEGNIEYNMKAIGEEGSPKFYEWNGASHMSFPTMHVDNDHVPLGDAVPMCLGLSWIEMQKRNQYDKYKSFRNLPECDSMKAGRSQWEEDYPTHGVNFNIWMQDFKKGDSGCNDGIYISSTDMCFKYKRMTQVCVMVKFRLDPETNTYSWLYTGGCYKDNEPVYYVNASPGTMNSFKDVQFEVRLDKRDWSQIVIRPEEAEAIEQAADADNSTAPGEEKVKETPAEKKIRKKREEIAKEADKGNTQYQPKGNYMFHEFFMFISLVSMFIAIILIGVMIWQIVSMKNAPGEEGENLIK